MDYEKELAKQKASMWKASTPKDPSVQTKTKKFVGPGGKPMAQDYTLDRKTGRWVVARDEEGNPMPSYEIPKTFNLLEAVVGGAGQPDKLDSLNAQIEQLQKALSVTEEE